MIGYKLLCLIVIIIILAPTHPFGFFKVKDLMTCSSNDQTALRSEGLASQTTSASAPSSMIDKSAAVLKSQSNSILDSTVSEVSKNTSRFTELPSNEPGAQERNSLELKKLNNATTAAELQTNSSQTLQSYPKLHDGPILLLPDQSESRPTNNVKLALSSIPSSPSAAKLVKVSTLDSSSAPPDIQEIINRITSEVLRSYFATQATSLVAGSSSQPVYPHNYVQAYPLNSITGSPLSPLHTKVANEMSTLQSKTNVVLQPSDGPTYSLKLLTGNAKNELSNVVSDSAEARSMQGISQSHQASPFEVVTGPVPNKLPIRVLTPSHLHSLHAHNQNEQTSHLSKTFYPIRHNSILDFMTAAPSDQSGYIQSTSQRYAHPIFRVHGPLESITGSVPIQLPSQIATSIENHPVQDPHQNHQISSLKFVSGAPSNQSPVYVPEPAQDYFLYTDNKKKIDDPIKFLINPGSTQYLMRVPSFVQSSPPRHQQISLLNMKMGLGPTLTPVHVSTYEQYSPLYNLYEKQASLQDFISSPTLAELPTHVSTSGPVTVEDFLTRSSMK